MTRCQAETERKLAVHQQRLRRAARLLLLAIPLAGLLLSACVPRTQGGTAMAVAGDRVYAASPQGKVLALDPQQRRKGLPFPGDGEWASPVEKGFGIIYAQPLPTGDSVFVASFDGKVRVLSRSSGAPQEDAPIFPPEKKPKNRSLVAAPALSGDTLLIAAANQLHAIDRSTGQPRWPRPFEAEDRIWASPVVMDDLVILASLDHRLYAVKVATGVEAWRFEAGGGIASTPLAAEGVIYFGSFDGHLYAVGKDGRPRWPTPFLVGKWVWSHPLYNAGTVYFGALNGVFYAVEAATGRERWHQDIGKAIRAAPALEAGVMAVATTAGGVYGMDPANGAMLWKRALSEDQSITTSADLVGDGGEIYIASEQGTVYALEAKTGKLAWSFPLKR